MKYTNDFQRYTCSYNGVSCDRYGLFVLERPKIPPTIKNVSSYEVLGKDGNMYVDNGTVKDREFPLKIGFYGDENEWHRKYRAVKNWIQDNKQNKYPFDVLQFSDETKYFYHIKRMYLNTSEREANTIGAVEIMCVISGYDYAMSGFRQIDFVEGEIMNKNQQNWQPIITLDMPTQTSTKTVIEFTAGNVITDYNGNVTLDEKYKFETYINETETMMIDLSKPLVKVYKMDGTEESGLIRCKYDFETLQKPLGLKWRAKSTGAIVKCSITPLYKE